MINPRLLRALEILNVKDIPSSLDGLFLLYDGKTFTYELYTENEQARVISGDSIEVAPDFFVKTVSTLIKMPLILGKEDLKLYNNKLHREVTYLRLALPSGLVQIEYPDEVLEVSCEETLEKVLRDSLKLT